MLTPTQSQKENPSCSGKHRPRPVQVLALGRPRTPETLVFEHRCGRDALDSWARRCISDSQANTSSEPLRTWMSHWPCPWRPPQLECCALVELGPCSQIKRKRWNRRNPTLSDSEILGPRGCHKNPQATKHLHALALQPCVLVLFDLWSWLTPRLQILLGTLVLAWCWWPAAPPDREEADVWSSLGGGAPKIFPHRHHQQPRRP